jgi:hypothetical protein
MTYYTSDSHTLLMTYYTLLMVTLQQYHRHNGILVISSTDHWEPNLQMSHIYYLGLPTRFRGSANNNFIQDLGMNTQTAKSTVPGKRWIQDHCREHDLPCLICLEESKNSRSWCEQSKQWADIYPEIPYSNVCGYYIWNQDPNDTSLNYGC